MPDSSPSYLFKIVTKILVIEVNVIFMQSALMLRHIMILTGKP